MNASRRERSVGTENATTNLVLSLASVIKDTKSRLTDDLAMVLFLICVEPHSSPRSMKFWFWFYLLKVATDVTLSEHRVLCHTKSTISAMLFPTTTVIVSSPWLTAKKLHQSRSFSDVNECAENPTVCGVGTCQNTGGSYECYCPRGYTDGNGTTCTGMECMHCPDSPSFEGYFSMGSWISGQSDFSSRPAQPGHPFHSVAGIVGQWPSSCNNMHWIFSDRPTTRVPELSDRCTEGLWNIRPVELGNKLAWHQLFHHDGPSWDW